MFQRLIKRLRPQGYVRTERKAQPFQPIGVSACWRWSLSCDAWRR